MAEQVGIVKFETDHGEVALSPSIVRQYLVNGQGNVSDQEVAMFVNLCKYQRLNPFLREAYLIKFGSNPATIVTGKEVFTKRAAKNPRFDGFLAGIVVKNDKGVERRQGALILEGETLIGGWAEVYLKDIRTPVFAEASFKEYARRKSDGSLTKTWKEMPETMIRKVALVQALREAFPEDLEGLYSPEEMPTSGETLPERPIQVTGEVIEMDSLRQPTPAPTEALRPVEAETPQITPEMMTLDIAKDMSMPTGKHEGEMLTDLVKTNRQYVKWYIANGNDELVVAAFVLLDKAWSAYLERQQGDPEQTDPEPSEEGKCPECVDGVRPDTGEPCDWCGGTGHV